MTKKTKKYICTSAIVGSVLLICALGTYVVNANYYDDHFLPGTVINTIDVGNMSHEDSSKLITEHVNTYSLKLKFRNGTRVLRYKDLKPVLQSDDLNKLIENQNRYSWIIREIGKNEDDIQVKYVVDEDVIRETVMNLPEVQNGSAPENAKVLMDFAGDFYTVAEKEGTQLDTEKLIQVIKHAVENGESEVSLEKEHVYIEPKIRMNGKKIKRRVKKLERFKKSEIELKKSDGTTQTLDFETTKDWLMSDEGCRIKEEDLMEHAREYMKVFAAEDDNYGCFKDFMTTNYGIHRFETEYVHGHRLNQTAMAKAIVKMLRTGGHHVLEPVYLNYVDSGVINSDLYVEVDICNQHVYVYKNHELVLDCDCVSGTKGSHDTPTGIFEVEEMEDGRRLEGYNSYGEKTYSVWVNYWISFYPHYGLHDASWRDEFGGDIYYYDGSHGCVNLPKSAVAEIYDIVDYGTPVLVFRGEEDVVSEEE